MEKEVEALVEAARTWVASSSSGADWDTVCGRLIRAVRALDRSLAKPGEGRDPAIEALARVEDFNRQHAERDAAEREAKAETKMRQIAREEAERTKIGYWPVDWVRSLIDQRVNHRLGVGEKGVEREAAYDHMRGQISDLFGQVKSIKADVLDKWNCHELQIWKAASPDQYDLERGIVARVGALEKRLAALESRGLGVGENGGECEHEFVDPTNSHVIANGYEVCTKCGLFKPPAPAPSRAPSGKCPVCYSSLLELECIRDRSHTPAPAPSLRTPGEGDYPAIGSSPQELAEWIQRSCDQAPVFTRAHGIARNEIHEILRKEFEVREKKAAEAAESAARAGALRECKAALDTSSTFKMAQYRIDALLAGGQEVAGG